MMKRSLRVAAYVLIGVALLGVTLLAPGSWAAPSSQPLGFTVPSPTPTTAPATATPVPPTGEPPTDQPPGPTPPAPPAPGGATPAAAGAMRLTIGADRTVVWPGLNVAFTVVLANQGAGPLSDVLLALALPAGLTPGTIQTPGAAWEGQTLRARVPVLAPGERFTVTFSAQVRGDLPLGSVIVSEVTAAATGAQRVTANITLVMPPAELPPTGGCAGAAWMAAR